MFQAHKKPIKCANNCVAAIPGISGSVNGDLHIDAEYLPSSVPEIDIKMDTLVNTALNTEDDEDEHKHTNGWDMMRLDDKIGNFAVNSTIPFGDLALLELFIEEEEEGKYY